MNRINRGWVRVVDWANGREKPTREYRVAGSGSGIKASTEKRKNCDYVEKGNGE